MMLGNVLGQISQLENGEVIFAKKPWTLSSEADVGRLDIDFRVPKVISDRGLEYFLEVSVALEVLEVFGARKPTRGECRALLMYYAEHDAYPEWVYESPKK
jgi:hypothetical protein